MKTHLPIISIVMVNGMSSEDITNYQQSDNYNKVILERILLSIQPYE